LPKISTVILKNAMSRLNILDISADMIVIHHMIEDAEMELTNEFTDSVQNLLISLNIKKSISEVDVESYGVGAMMPLDMPDEILLNNTALYGV
jgi:hypothetical protein